MTTFFNKTNFLSVVGGLIFLLIFFLGYLYVDESWYQHRDDGVITMSVAKNWVDYGFFGVSVSGPIVEASSSPLELFIYALFYTIWHVSYDTYAFYQTLVSTFLLGAIFIRFFSNKILFSIIATSIVAFALTKFFHFFEWHASGMENALSHVFFLATFYILYKAIDEGKVNYLTAGIVFLATISRLDSVYHISIILVFFSIYWYITYKNFKAFNFSLIVLILWSIFHCWRYYYFGDMLPNTAYAQGISVMERLDALFSLDRAYLRQSMNLGREIFLNHAGWLLFILPILFYFTEKTRLLYFSTLLVFSISLTSYINPFLFGATRLDHNRSTTQMILYVFLVLSIYFYGIKSNRDKAFIFSLLFPFIVWYYITLGYHSKPLCCNTNSFDKTRIKFQTISKDNHINLATVSSPDLGVLSWHKQFNIIDIGRLGSPIMAQIKGDKVLLKKYYLQYALPDIIELHNGWSCGYAFLLSDIHFKTLYRPLDTKITNWTKNNCQDAPLSKSGIWIRRNIEETSISKERIFLDKLQAKWDLSVVDWELSQCYSDATNSCQYITRVLYHLLPTIRRENDYMKLLNLVSQQPLNAYDTYLLKGFSNPLEYKNALKYIKLDR